MKSKFKKGVLRFVIINVVIFTIVLAVIPAFIMKKMLNEKVVYTKVWTPEEYGVEKADTLYLKSSDDYTVEVFSVEADNPKCAIICLTGMRNPSVSVYYGHAKMFFDKSYSSFLTEVRGHGGSDGYRICAGYQEWRDVEAVTNYIKSQPQYKDVPIVVMGISMGGVVAINSIGQNDDIDALISISAYSSWEDIFCDNMANSAPSFLVSMERPFVNLVSMFKYGVNSWTVRPKTLIKELDGRPALMMHTKEDSQVGYSNFERIINNAPKGVETYVRDGNKHFFATDFANPQCDTVYCDRVNGFINRVVTGHTMNYIGLSHINTTIPQ